MPTDEPQPPPPTKIPKPPDHLCDTGKKCFTYLAKVLTDAELLTVADVMPLEMLCDAYAQWLGALKLRKAAGVIINITKDDEIVNSYESPESKLCRSLSADCNRWFKVLGLGPAYRVGLRMNAPEGDDIDDPLAAAIANG